MTTDLFIRTWHGDFEWLEYCLRSCRKSLKGFRQIHLAMSDPDAEAIKSRVNTEGCIIHATGPDWSDGYIQQMSDKLHADLYSDADFIVHTDSDCVWTRDISPSDLMEGGKPVYLRHPFGTEPNPWPEIVEKILGFRSPYSYMRRHPFIYPRGIYQTYRNWLLARHKVPLHEYVKAQPYRSFIEYESIGAWAWSYQNDLFTWKDESEFPVFAHQNWSWGGLNDEIRAHLEQILAS